MRNNCWLMPAWAQLSITIWPIWSLTPLKVVVIWI